MERPPESIRVINAIAEAAGKVCDDLVKEITQLKGYLAAYAKELGCSPNPVSIMAEIMLLKAKAEPNDDKTPSKPH